MRSALRAAMLAIALAPWANAQEVRQPSDWKKMYDDASVQLRAAQDRKSEMANTIAQLTARVAALQTQLQAAQDQLNSLNQRFEADIARTYLLNAAYTGWESFTLQNPDVRDRWRAFWAFVPGGLKSDFPLVGDPQWPLAMP